jgi:dipeptidyl-peptidase-4
MKFFVLLVILCSFYLNAEQSEKLTFEQVYLNRGEALLRPLPEIPGWCDDSHYTETRSGKIYLVDARSGHSLVLLDTETVKKNAPAALDWSKPSDQTANYAQAVFINEGDIYLFQKKTGLTRRLTTTPGEEKNPCFAPDGSYLAYTLDGNLYVSDTASGISSRLTSDGSEEILNGYASWVYYEEVLGRGSKYRAFDWSPDSSRIAFLRFDQSQVPLFPLFDANGVYGRLEMQRYPKPGFPNPQVKIGVIDLKTRLTRWIDFADGPDHYLTCLGWNQASSKLYLQWLNRDQEELKVFAYDCHSQKLQLMYEEKQKAWIDFLNNEDFVVLSDGGFVLRSSKDGWDHLYLIASDGSEKKLTSGEWSVKKISYVDEHRRLICFSAAREDSTATDLYAVPLEGGSIKRLTIFSGTNDVTFSPQGSFFLNRYSSLQKPSCLQICDRSGRQVRLIGDSAGPAFNRCRLAKTELFRIPSIDGFLLPALWFLPPGFDPAKKYPVIVSIYGGPGNAQVSDSFPRRLNDYFLAQQGIIVLKVDHRGSGHFGKKAMVAMHRCLGKWEIHDYSQAVAYLRGLPFVDGQKIGISGGSYGGYVAALAIMAAPELFAFASADFSVIDWTLYDSVYTERYMDTPAQNPDGYKQSSVLSYLDKYRGGLRLTVGTMDDNVHWQNTLQLIDRLLNMGKAAELDIFPGERHGVRGQKKGEFARLEINFWLRVFFGSKLPE